MPPNYTKLPSSDGQANGDDPNKPPQDSEGGKPKDFDHESYALRQLFLHIGLVVVLLFVWLGFKLFEPTYVPPDVSNYVNLRTIDAEFLDLDNPTRRMIMVGDLHGMMHSLDDLLEVLKYNSSNDLLLHLGDLTAKGPHSNELVTRFAAANVTGVRGNNDQKVIEWYGWFEWVKSNRGGDVWLEALHKQNITPKQAKKLKLWKNLRYSFPKGWDWGGDHFRVARSLSPSDYEYLSSLPIVIHLPSLHTFVVHAGLLPMDPAHHLRSLRQPLAVAPSLPSNPTEDDIQQARYNQELAVLNDIEPNTDPYIKLNLRDIHDLNPVRRGPQDHDDNDPWSDVWNSVISRCHGFDPEDSVSSQLQDYQLDRTEERVWRKRKSLPCYPITVVYSHASSRGLDLKKWSKGLDTGCVNGNGLTAMVLGKGRHHRPKPEEPAAKLPGDGDDDERDIEVPFGEGYNARLVSVSCPTPPPIDD